MTDKPSLTTRIGMALHVLREGVDAFGAYTDPDEDLFRRITGSNRDLTPIGQDRAREISIKLWRENPMARRLIEMIVDFVVGEGVTYQAADDRAQETLDTFWTDPAMRLDLRHRDFVRDMSLTGELAFRTFVAGRSRLGFIDVERIKTVRKDPDNALIDRTLVLRPKSIGLPEEELAILAPEGVDDKRTGEALFYAINRLTAATRGTPDLLALADWIDGYDQLLWNMIDRSALVNAFLWDVTLTGEDDAGIQAWISKHGAPPRPGTVRAHNEKEVWKAESPSLGASETESASRLIKNMVLGGAGLPEGWFADGDAANRATLVAQSDPTYKMLVSRQLYVRYVFEDILTWRLEADVEQGLLPAGTDTSVTVNMPEPNETDSKAIAAALPQLVNALTAAIDGEFIDTKSARRLFITMAGQLGVDLDEDEIEEAVEAEAVEREAEEEALRQEEAKALAAMGLGGAPVPGQNGPGAPTPPAKAPRRLTVAK